MCDRFGETGPMNPGDPLQHQHISSSSAFLKKILFAAWLSIFMCSRSVAAGSCWFLSKLIPAYSVNAPFQNMKNYINLGVSFVFLISYGRLWNPLTFAFLSFCSLGLLRIFLVTV